MTAQALCAPIERLYFSQLFTSNFIPRRSRIYNRYLSLLGFILEIPCPKRNRDRYLIIYDDFSAQYHSSKDFHLCICQDMSRHMSLIDSEDLQVHYQHAFRRVNQIIENHFALGDIIRVRKFGSQHHNARVIEHDQALIKICFFERKSQLEMWIHCQSSMIEQSFSSFSIHRTISSFSSLSSNDTNSQNVSTNVDSDLSRLRKRARHVNTESMNRTRNN